MLWNMWPIYHATQACLLWSEHQQYPLIYINSTPTHSLVHTEHTHSRKTNHKISVSLVGNNPFSFKIKYVENNTHIHSIHKWAEQNASLAKFLCWILSHGSDTGYYM
jgi:hypothetical protein